MNNMMNKMMEQMMEQMMPKMMEMMMTSMMNAMMGSANPQVANAAVETPAKQETMSRADFLALEESKTEVAEVVESTPVDLICNPATPRTLYFNQGVSKDVWTINWIKIKKAYPNVKYDKNTKGFRWNKEHTSEFLACARTYTVVSQLSDADKQAVAEYRKAKAQKMAEYYQKKAQE